MPNNESTTKFKADISQLKSAMQQAQREVKLANAQFKAASAGMDDWSKSTDGLTAKLKQLDKVQAAQKKQLDLLNDELKLTVKQYGENSAQADNLRIRIENQKAALAKTEKEIRDYSKALDNCGKETDQLGDESKETEKQVDNLSDGFSTAKGVLADLVASGIKAAIAGLKDLAKFAKEAYEEFDKGADAVIKATGATGDAAKELEQNYANLTQNIIGDMESMGSALGEVNTRFGFTGEELENATEQFVKFADITGTDATESVRLVSRALENAGMDSSEYAHLLDVLAKAGQTTGVSVSNLTESVTKNGATLRQLGYTTEESVAMLAKFEKEGVNTETVLAGMKKAVAQWGKDGKNAKEEYQKVLEEIAKTEDIAEASEKAIEAFGTKAGPELVEDIQAGKLEYKDFLDVLQKSEGTVTETYEATQDGFDKIKLAIQGGKAELGQWVRDMATEHQDQIVSVINKVKEVIKNVISWVVKNADVIIETIKSIGKALAIIWAVKKAAAMATAINGVITAIKGMATVANVAASATTALSGASGTLAALCSPGGAIVLGLAAIATVTATVISLTKEQAREVDVLTDSEKESIQASHDLKTAYDEMEQTRRNSMGAIDNEFSYYQELLQEFDSIVGGNGQVKQGYEERAQFIMTTLNQALGMEMEMQDGIIQNYAKERQAINELLETKKAEAILQANEAAYTEAIQKKTEAANTYVKAQQTFNDVLARAEAKAVEVNKANMEYARILKEDGVMAAQEYIKTQTDVYAEYEKLQQEVTDTRGALHEATIAYQGYNQTIQNYEGLSAAIISGDTKKINEALLQTENSFKTANNTTADALKKQRDQFEENYKTLKKAVEDGDQTVTQQMVDDAKKLADMAQAEYLKSGGQSVAGYVKGMKDNSKYAEQAAKELGYDSYEDFNESLGINSPSKKTYQSGEYFAQGFINGMDSKSSAIYQKAYALAQKAIEGLRKGQQEGSPSKITYESGKFFTQGYINGIASMTSKLIKTTKKVAKTAIKQGLKISKGDFASAAEKVVESFTEPLESQLNLMLDKISYKNEQKIKQFDNTISKLQKKLSAEKDENRKKELQAEIDAQNKAKQQYQTASNKFIQQFTQSMNQYQNKAQALITSTMEGITSKYTEQYDALIAKQNELVSKLKDAEGLYDYTDEGEMVISNLEMQTKRIQQYTGKLKWLKSIVSEELFAEVANMDMKTGRQFMDKLQKMSVAEIKEFDQAYLEKLSMAEEAGKIYDKEINAVTKAYDKAIKEAAKNIPDEMKDLGTEALKGFLSGLTSNTDYMETEIKTFIAGMVDTFKEQLDINSPSKVMENIGKMTGLGFADGLKETVGMAKAAATTVSGAVISPMAARYPGNVSNSSVINNNYNLVQNNTSPKALTALETYQARRQQVAMVKAMM